LVMFLLLIYVIVSPNESSVAAGDIL